MSKFFKKIAVLTATLMAVSGALISHSQNASAAGAAPSAVTFSRSETTGLVTVNWTAPGDMTNVTGYKVVVDATGAGKQVSIVINDNSASTTKLCFPYNGNITSYVASITATDSNPTFDSSNSTVWKSSATQNGMGNVSGGSVCTTNTTAYSYSVTFDPGTGTGSMSSISGSAFAITLPPNSFTKTGETFQGWATSSGGPVVYSDSQTISMSASTTLNLYAKWNGDAASAAINYAAGTGGSGSGPTSPLSVNINDTFTVPSNTFSKTGYSFTWWSDGIDTFTAGSTYPKTGTVSSGPVTLTANWSANKYAYDANTGTGTAMSDQTYAGSQLTASTNTYTAPSGYEFDGWCTAQLAVGTTTCNGSNTKYSEGANIPAPSSATVTLYAIWKTPSAGGGGGGGGSAPAPVYVPKPPTISSISAPEVCAVTSQLVIKGTNLSGATVKVDDQSAQVVSSSSTEMQVTLPSASVGTKTLTVTNSDGSATTSIKYAFADTPIFVNFTYPETYKNRDFKYTFSADEAAKYEITGQMPSGLTLNPLTGEITGAPTQEGNFVFNIVASNICGSTPLIVYMFVDKEIPAAFTCSVAFNILRSDNISDVKLANLQTCLAKTETLSPKYVDPIIFLSGGIPSYLTEDEALTHPRYLPIIEVIQKLKVNAQIYLGAFEGSLSSVQVNVYWPEPEL